jgi:hypothetical protein
MIAKKLAHCKAIVFSAKTSHFIREFYASFALSNDF